MRIAVQSINPSRTPSPNIQNRPRLNRHCPSPSPSPDSKRPYPLTRTALPTSQDTILIAKTIQYEETPFRSTPVKGERRVGRRWAEGRGGVAEGRRELGMPLEFEVGGSNQELNYLCLLREKEESIRELRRLIEGDYDGGRQLREWGKQLKVLQIQNECLMSIIHSKQYHLLPSQEEQLRGRVEQLKLSLADRQKEGEQTARTKREVERELQEFREKYGMMEVEYGRVRGEVEHMGKQLQGKIHQAMQSYQHIILKLEADLEEMRKKVGKLEEKMEHFKEVASFSSMRQKGSKEVREGALPNRVSQLMDRMRQMEESVEDKLRKQQQNYQRLAQSGSQASSLSLSSNSLEQVLKEAIGSRQEELSHCRVELEEKSRVIQELQCQNSQLKQTISTQSHLSYLAEQLSQHCLKLEASCVRLDGHRCMGGGEGELVVEDHRYELQVSEEMNRRLMGLKIGYQDMLEEMQEWNKGEVELNIQGELAWLKRNIQEWHQHHYLFTILQQPPPNPGQHPSEQPNPLARMLASLQAFIDQKRTQYQQLLTQIKVAAKALRTQEQELQQRASALQQLEREREELCEEILARHRCAGVEEKMGAQLREFTRRVDKVAKWQRERRKGVRRVVEGELGVELQWLIDRGRAGKVGK